MLSNPQLVTVGKGWDISSRADALNIRVPLVLLSLVTGGYYVQGDGGGGVYNRAAVAPAHNGYFQSLDGAFWVLSSVNANVRQFGAKGDGVTDDTVAINNALAAFTFINVPGGNYNFTTINSGFANQTLALNGGANLQPQTWNITALNITHEAFTITGGKITSPAMWDGSNSQRTYGTIWVTADGFVASKVWLYNIPRAGIHFEACTNGRVENCRLDGNYPFADYDPSLTTAQIAIDYDPPANDNPSLVVIGCRITTCIQGVLPANYGSGEERGIVIVGNTFALCWDHGVYCSISSGATITGNNFLNCKFPVVVSGSSSVVSGNVLIATESVNDNGQAVISMRGCRGAVVSDNTLRGLGAAILIDSISTGPKIVEGNSVTGNTIVRLGTGLATAAIRLGSETEECYNNSIKDNTITGDFCSSDGVISITMAATFRGMNNRVTDNVITTNDAVPHIVADLHDGLIITDNDFISTANATGATLVRMVYLQDCENYVVSENSFKYQTGGTDVTVRGIQTNDVAGLVERNKFYLTAAALVAFDAVGFVAGQRLANQIDMSSPMKGDVNWLAGNITITIANGNSIPSSVVTFSPTSAGGADQQATKGIFVDVTVPGDITFTTGDGTALAANAPLQYVIH